MKNLLLIGMFLASSTVTMQAQSTPVIKVTLLGTGIPLVNIAALAAADKALSGLLVEAGTERFLFDCGQGVYRRLYQSGGSVMNPNLAVDKVFISHMHSDHFADLPALYILGALFRYASPTDADATVPLRVWGPGASVNGPVGTWAMMQSLRTAFDSDIYVRQLFTDPNSLAFANSALETLNSTIELWPDVVYSNNGVTVTAFLVDHDPVTPAYGFRVDYQGHSFVYSGDTTYSTNLISHATNVDVLVHEVYGYPRTFAPPIYDYHTSPEDAARVFNATKPKQAVFTHLVIPPGTTANDLVSRTRAAGYTGPLTAGLDLMEIDINADGVTITPPPGAPSNVNDVPATSDSAEVYKYRLNRGAKPTN